MSGKSLLASAHRYRLHVGDNLPQQVHGMQAQAAVGPLPRVQLCHNMICAGFAQVQSSGCGPKGVPACMMAGQDSQGEVPCTCAKTKGYATEGACVAQWHPHVTGMSAFLNAWHMLPRGLHQRARPPGWWPGRTGTPCRKADRPRQWNTLYPNLSWRGAHQRAHPPGWWPGRTGTTPPQSGSASPMANPTP